jgi:hypothetical protein
MLSPSCNDPAQITTLRRKMLDYKFVNAYNPVTFFTSQGSTNMALDAFLKISDIPGESTDDTSKADRHVISLFK